MSATIRIFFTVIILFGSLPLSVSQASADQKEEIIATVDPAPIRMDEQLFVQEPLPDPDLTEAETKEILSIPQEQTDPHGPQRTTYEGGIPAHAYSPFDDVEEASCPPGGCDYQPGVLLIKLEEDVELQVTRAGVQRTTDASLNALLDEQGIASIEPIFPNAQPSAPGRSVEGQPLPDLTRWVKLEMRDEDADLSQSLEAFQRSPQVQTAELDYLRRPEGESGEFFSLQQISGHLPGPSSDPLYKDQWHLDATNVPQAWQWLEDNGYEPGGDRDIVVAVIDTGVDYTHPDLAVNMWVNSLEFNGSPGVDDDGNGYVDDIHGADMVTPDGDPRDDHGHGTHVAGIIAAQAGNGIGGVGVAYNVQVMALKAAQYSGVLASSDIAEAIYYAVEKGADVINMSFGGYARSSVEEDALVVAFGQAVLVAAAGNDSKVNLPCPFGRDMYPAAYNWVIGVMAANESARRAYFSNIDCYFQDVHEYELMAPGVDVWSTLPDNNYGAWDGTSVATPIVSGIAALVRTRWNDRDVYSPSFIMGQIVANTSVRDGGFVDAISPLFSSPQPELYYLEHWVFDTKEQNSLNDNDGILDSGETIDLAIVIKNSGSNAQPVTVTLETVGEMGEESDPFTTFLTSTVKYGSINSFNQKDNGLVYVSTGIVTTVNHPFRFSLSPNTPNDHHIPFLVTIESRNGIDPNDKKVYTFKTRFILIVQNEKELIGRLNEDTTLSKDYFWLIAGPLWIEPGVSVTITEGTQVQWGSPAQLDPNNEPEKSRILNQGRLLIQGTYTEPVELFPMNPINYLCNQVSIDSFNYENNIFSVFYTKVDSPEWGQSGIERGPNSIDHSIIKNDISFGGEGFTLNGDPQRTTNTIVEMTEDFEINPYNADTCLFYAKKGTVFYPFSNGLVTNTVFLQNYLGNKVWTGYIGGQFATEVAAIEGTRYKGNAFLNKYWDTDKDHWMRFSCEGGGLWVGLAGNFWGTTSNTLIEATMYNDCKDWEGNEHVVHVAYHPILTTPLTSTYPFVWDIIISNDEESDLDVVDTGKVTFTVKFNRDMDMSIQPHVSFGPATSSSDITIHPINGNWVDQKTWIGTYLITPIIDNGFHLIRVADAVAADDPWFIIGDDAGRFRFEINCTDEMLLEAFGGEGYVDLMWYLGDFDLLAGFNLYRAETITETYAKINSSLIPPNQRIWQDRNVIPGRTYYYKFTVVKSDMTESYFSNVAIGVPVDTVPPVIKHTPVTEAPAKIPLSLTAIVTDNIRVQSVTLLYKHISETVYSSIEMINLIDHEYFAKIPDSTMMPPGIYYFIEAFDGINISSQGGELDPYMITVTEWPCFICLPIITKCF